MRTGQYVNNKKNHLCATGRKNRQREVLKVQNIGHAARNHCEFTCLPVWNERNRTGCMRSNSRTGNRVY